MRLFLKLLAFCGVAALVGAGCASAENKLGRGLNNLTEPLRMGEFNRSYEQAYLWEGPDAAYGKGTIRGINRTLGRTLVGAVEVLTFPIPSKPYMKPEHPVYPDSYHPGLVDNPVTQPSNALGFDGGDIAPFVPGSRFRIFD
jgi:putative exosortase-associated protein (TIGR04073 family)